MTPESGEYVAVTDFDDAVVEGAVEALKEIATAVLDRHPEMSREVYFVKQEMDTYDPETGELQKIKIVGFKTGKKRKNDLLQNAFLETVV